LAEEKEEGKFLVEGGEGRFSFQGKERGVGTRQPELGEEVL